jgi:hypothetical protein
MAAHREADMIAARPAVQALPAPFRRFVTAYKAKHARLPTRQEAIAAVIPQLTYAELGAVINNHTISRSWRIAAARRAVAIERKAREAAP